MTPSSSRRRKPPQEFELEPEKNNRVGLVLMRSSKDIVITPNTPFVIIPGEKGEGWTLRVYEDHEQAKPVDSQ